jgi:hypothetical protein
MTNPPHEHAVEPPAEARPALVGLLADNPGTRFLTRRMGVALGLYLLVAASLASYSVNNDSVVYLDFMRRLVGLPASAPPTAQFGSALVSFPFFLVARAFDAAGLHTLRGAPFDQLSIVVAGVLALVATAYLGWKLLTKLDLPAGPGVIALTIVGTPLFYYAALLPSYKQAIDTCLATLAFVLLWRALEQPSRGRIALLGLAIALSVVTRTANVALVPGLVLPFVLRRDLRAAVGVLGATVTIVLCLYAIPLARGIEIHHVKLPKVALVSGGGRVAAAHVVALTDFGLCKEYPWQLTLRQCLHNKIGIWPSGTAPFKMLFTLHRGLFLWTPLTAFATLGFVLLVRRRRDRRDFLYGVSLAALGLWLVHILWGDFWDNGFSFSQRFLTALFPVFLLGSAELVRRWRGAALAVLSVCAVFSLGLALTFWVGYKGISADDGVDRMVKLYTTGERTPQQLVRRVGVQARGRWLGH